MKSSSFCLLLTLLFFVSPTLAQSLSFLTYEGYLEDLNGNPVNDSLPMRVELQGVNSTACLLYWEDHPTIAVVNGAFKIAVGRGQNSTGSVDLATYFSNRTTTLSGCTFEPTLSNALRKMQIFIDGEAFSEFVLSEAPRAMFAEDTDRISGRRVSTGSPSNGQVLRWNQSLSLWEPSAETPSNPGTVTSVATSGDFTGGPITTSGTLSLTNTGVTAGTYPKVTVTATGRVTAGGPLLASDIPALDWAKITTGKPTNLSGYGITDAVRSLGGVVATQSGLDASKGAAGTAGTLYVATDTQKIYLSNGSSWTEVANSSSSAGTVTSISTGTGLIGGPITGAGTISIADGGVGTTQIAVGAVTSDRIADGAITSVDIGNNQVTDAKISAVGVGKIASGAGLYLTYQPGGTACAAGQTLKWINSRWECATDNEGALPGGSTAGQFLRWDGTGWVASTDGAQIVGLNANNLSAGTLPAGRLPAFSGDVTSTAGSTGLSLSTTGVVAGTYRSVTVDSKGRVTLGSNPTSLAEYGINDAVANLGSVPSIQSGLDAAKPAAGQVGRLYVATDVQKIYRDSGASWVTVAVGAAGSGTVTGITAGAGLTGGTITSSGTISIATGGVDSSKIADGSVTSAKLAIVPTLTPGTFGSSVEIPTITVNDKGQVTQVTSVPFNTSPTGQALELNKIWVGEAGNSAQARYFGAGDLRNSLGNPQIPTSCLASQTMTWNSINDQFSCQSISIAPAQVAGLGNAATRNTGTSSGQVPVLDGTGRLPASTIPDLETCTDANHVRIPGVPNKGVRPFCLENLNLPPTSYVDAEVSCASKAMRLCSPIQLQEACNFNSSLIPTSFLWIGPVVSSSQALNVDLTNTCLVADKVSFTSSSTLRAYRCCR